MKTPIVIIALIVSLLSPLIMMLIMPKKSASQPGPTTEPVLPFKAQFVGSEGALRFYRVTDSDSGRHYIVTTFYQNSVSVTKE